MAQSASVLPAQRRAGRVDLVSLLVLANTLALIFWVLTFGDELVFRRRPESVSWHVWVLLDPFVHAAVAFLVTLPLVLRPAASGRRFSRLASALIAGVFIDLDHFAAAGSFSLAQAASLPGGRPETHSLLFVLACALLAYLMTRHPIDGVLIFAALASHVLRDASTGGTPLLWPYSFERLSLPVYYAAELGLCLAVWGAARFIPEKPWVRKRSHFPEPGIPLSGASQIIKKV